MSSADRFLGPKPREPCRKFTRSISQKDTEGTAPPRRHCICAAPARHYRGSQGAAAPKWNGPWTQNLKLASMSSIGPGSTMGGSSAAYARASARCARDNGALLRAPRARGRRGHGAHGLRPIDRILRRSDREEAAEPFPARLGGAVVRHRGLQPRLLVLSEP